jgi:hypothetical protein
MVKNEIHNHKWRNMWKNCKPYWSMTATVHLYWAYFVLLFTKRYKFLSDALNLLKKVCHDFERKVLKILTKLSFTHSSHIANATLGPEEVTTELFSWTFADTEMDHPWVCAAAVSQFA